MTAGTAETAGTAGTSARDRRSAALGWLRRWDVQQETYLPQREDRFTILVDAVAQVAGSAPTVVDLGCGPGSLSVRVLDRLPGATVIGVDADPVLLALAEGAYGDRPGLRLVDADLRDADWPAALGLPAPADAVVSTTALHWLAPDELPALYAGVARLLRPGGILLNGDHVGLPAAVPRLGELARSLATLRMQRLRDSRPGYEDWAAWWTAVLADPAYAEAAAERDRRRHEHPRREVDATYDDHVAALRAAGFHEVDVLWQAGDDRVLAALRD